MAVTIDGIRRLPDLALELVAGRDGGDNEIRWVHVSEIEDPTRWLRGGELLLTTGLQLEGDDAFRAYVRRLADAGCAGIGFGVGIDHDTVPEAMIAEADRVGIPVLRIPVDAPYISISEAVSNMIAEERFDAISRAFSAQQALTRSAIAGSIDTVVHEIARQIRGWAIHTDGEGRLQARWPDDAAARLPALLPDIFRARTSSAIVGPSDSTVIHALTTDGVPRGYLVVGIDRPIGTFERLVLQGAAAILTLESERNRSLTGRLRRLQADTLRMLLRSPQPPYDISRQVQGWGLDLFALRVSVTLVSDEHGSELVEAILSMLSDRGIPGAACAMPWREGLTQVAVLVDDSDATLDLVAATITESAPASFTGIGEAGTIDRVRHLYRNSLNAASIGQLDRRAVTRFDDLPAMQLLLGSDNTDAVRSFVAQVLGDLAAPVAPGRDADLRTTLELFLTHNGHWNEAATALGIHRHTLKARIERIAQITGRNPESSYGRMELWLAVLAENSRAVEPH